MKTMAGQSVHAAAGIDDWDGAVFCDPLLHLLPVRSVLLLVFIIVKQLCITLKRSGSPGFAVHLFELRRFWSLYWFDPAW
jgi:hypothetical protein